MSGTGRIGHDRTCLGPWQSVKRGKPLLCTAQKMLETHAALHYVALQQRSFDVAEETKVEEKIEAAVEAVTAPAKTVAEKNQAVAAPAAKAKRIAKKPVRRARK